MDLSLLFMPQAVYGICQCSFKSLEANRYHRYYQNNHCSKNKDIQ